MGGLSRATSTRGASAGIGSAGASGAATAAGAAGAATAAGAAGAATAAGAAGAATAAGAAGAATAAGAAGAATAAERELPTRWAMTRPASVPAVATSATPATSAEIRSPKRRVGSPVFVAGRPRSTSAEARATGALSVFAVDHVVARALPSSKARKRGEADGGAAALGSRLAPTVGLATARTTTFAFGTGANGGDAKVAVRRLTSSPGSGTLGLASVADGGSTKMRVGSFAARTGLACCTERGAAPPMALLPTPMVASTETLAAAGEGGTRSVEAAAATDGEPTDGHAPLSVGRGGSGNTCVPPFSAGGPPAARERG